MAAAAHPPAQPEASGSPEDIMFDKAEMAGSVEDLRKEREVLQADIESIEKAIADATEEQKGPMQRGLEYRRIRLQTVEVRITETETTLKTEA